MARLQQSDEEIVTVLGAPHHREGSLDYNHQRGALLAGFAAATTRAVRWAAAGGQSCGSTRISGCCVAGMRCRHCLV